jgi:hypothetical protein
MYRLKEHIVHRELAWGKRTALELAPDERLVNKMEHEQYCTQWHKDRQYAIENERDIAGGRMRIDTK